MGVIQDLLGGTAAKASAAAAADTYRKQQAAVQGLNAYADQVPGQFNQIAGGFDPYRQAGTRALERLMGGLGLGGGASGGADFTSAYRSQPGYQSGLDTGLTGAQRGLNAGNIGQSGRALKALYRYGSDYEDQRSGDYLSRLSGVAGAGQAATGAATGIQSQGKMGEMGLRQLAFGGDMNAAGTIGQGMVASAQARQSGLQNLLGTAAYLGGTFLGGPMGGRLADGLKSLWRRRTI